MGFTGNYILYDLPEYLKLQQIFLSNTIGMSDTNLRFIHQTDDLSCEVDLFIALWSINETPFELRNDIFTRVKSKYYLITFHKNFGGDNIKYFEKFVSNSLNYKWTKYDVFCCPDNYYLLGEKL